MSICFGGCAVGGSLTPPPPPNATTRLPTRPSVNDMARKAAVGGSGWGMSGVNPWDAPTARTTYVDYTPPPICS